MNGARTALLVLASTLLAYVIIHIAFTLVFTTSDALAIAGLLLAGYFGLPKRKPKNSLELSKLIKTFLIPNKLKHTALPWHTGAESESPIYWTNPNENDDQTTHMDEFYMTRKGSVKVLIKRKISHHILREKNEPCEWTILLGGPHAGIARVVVHSTINSYELDPDKIFEYLDDRFNLIFEEDLMKDSFGSGERQYRIGLKKYQTSYLKFAYSCGSAGCLIAITIE